MKICFTVIANYQTHFKNFTDDMTDIMVSTWQGVLSDVTYEEASRGLMMFLRSDTKGFPPSPGQVLDCCKRGEMEQMTAMEAWSLVTRALSNSIYHSEEEFAQLPEIVQRAVGSPENLREMAQVDTDTVQSVEKSHFIRTFNAQVSKQAEYIKMPDVVREILDKKPVKKIEAVNGHDLIDDEEKYKRPEMPSSLKERWAKIQRRLAE